MQNIPYSVKISRRARKMRITVYPHTKIFGKKHLRINIGEHKKHSLLNKDGFGAGVYCDSSVVLTLPVGLDFRRAEQFIKDKFFWIQKTLESFKPYKNRTIVKSRKKDYAQHRQQALELAKTKVEQWNKIYNFSYNRVNIKNQKTRWGSCSKKGNLNFNYKIVHLPSALADYLIVHELCHLKEFNHSKNFWQLVAQTMPEYKSLRKELHNFSNP